MVPDLAYDPATLHKISRSKWRRWLFRNIAHRWALDFNRGFTACIHCGAEVSDEYAHRFDLQLPLHVPPYGWRGRVVFRPQYLKHQAYRIITGVTYS